MASESIIGVGIGIIAFTMIVASLYLFNKLRKFISKKFFKIDPYRKIKDKMDKYQEQENLRKQGYVNKLKEKKEILKNKRKENENGRL